MRRGRSGIGGWRSDNPRPFRPRAGGPPHSRPPRMYGLHDSPHFPPPRAGFNRLPPPFASRQTELANENTAKESHERNKYRHFPNTQHRSDRGHLHQRSIAPYFNKHQNNDNHYSSRHRISFGDSEKSFPGNVNDLGDVDHRHPPNSRSSDNYGKRHTTWINPALENRTYNRNYDRSPQKLYKNHESNDNRLLSEDYTGHRPPSSDHYDGSCNQANTAFTRSVDDTVDIIRKRLRDRSDGQQITSHQPVSQDNDEREKIDSNKTYLESRNEQPSKKRIQRPVQVKSNCDKIKNNIVHQLFKMDKNKIHKLMDNPSSSTKFDYAISSLITESQNSLNRQLRSVAEKSLTNSNCINDQNNTIYEDTFMKQMQCLLDPQDTVFLEDIKPIVMAELNKVLQLDEFVQEDNIYEGDQTPPQPSQQPDSTYYEDQPYNYENKLYEQELESELYFNKSGDSRDNDNMFSSNQEATQLYERRPTKHLEYTKEDEIIRRHSIDCQRQSRRSIDTSNEEMFSTQNTLPLFNTNTENISEDEDPFAEFDKQYHVAVDHNFINNDDDFCSPAQSATSSSNKSPNMQREITTTVPISNMDTKYLTTEIDSQFERLVKSPLKLQSSSHQQDNIKLELLDHPKENVSSSINNETVINQDHKIVENKKESSTKPNEKLENSSNIVKVTTPNARKRSISQMPSHRKEKRKKSESNPVNLEQHDSGANSTYSLKSQSVTKDISNTDLSKETMDNSSISKNVDTIEKTNTEKYIKRKNELRKSKDSELNKKNNSTLTSHSTLSLKDSSSSSSIISQTPSKSDAKIKLKTIDMFMDQPKKSTPLHQAHRNTATTPAVLTSKISDENKTKTQSKLTSKIAVKHASTQVMRKVQTKEVQTTISKCSKNRFSQTDRKKLNTKAVQTDPVSIERNASKATDCFERMKEIDLEIQVLLQEKFKLYNSIESKESCQSTMPTLGMTVLSVTPVSEEKSEVEDFENVLSEDAIVDSFTSIPTEELEQIALETVEHEKTELIVSERLSRRKNRLSRDIDRTASPSVTQSGRRVKPPNISLLEQIISSDKPLEDIIVLDELEETEKPPVKSTKKKSQKKSTKKKSVKNVKAKPSIDYSSFNLKECTVVLERQDISQYLIQLSDLEIGQFSPLSVSMDSVPELMQPEIEIPPQEECKAELKVEELKPDDIPNVIHIDMLDVSEDIVIGGVCEVKCDDSNSTSHELSISEEIILDNSQSSCEEVFTADTNQEDNVCKMFDYSTDDNLIKDSVTVSGNGDAVLAIETIDSNFLAACLDGNVYHFNGDGQLLNTLRGSNLAVTCLTIVKEKTGTTVYTGSLDSRIRHYDLESGLEKGLECNVLSPIQTMDRAWDTVFVGTRTGFVLQFECKNNMLIPVSTVKFSEQSILALRALKEGPRKVLLVAARSEDVTIKDAQTGLLLRTLSGPKMTVYTLLFEDGKVYCGTSSHQVHVFDYSSGSHVGTHEGGKGAVCLRASGGLLFAGCYDGCVYVYKEGEPRPLAQLRGPGLMLLSLAIVGTKIIAGYKDRSLYIWKIPLSILREMIL